jgi:hypothetical protein
MYCRLIPTAVPARGFYARDFVNDKIGDFMYKLLRIFSMLGRFFLSIASSSISLDII